MRDGRIAAGDGCRSERWRWRLFKFYTRSPIVAGPAPAFAVTLQYSYSRRELQPIMTASVRGPIAGERMPNGGIPSILQDRLFGYSNSGIEASWCRAPIDFAQFDCYDTRPWKQAIL